MSCPARLIVNPPASGIQNMAVDQALLDACENTPVLRFYRWQEPTLSLGYFQPAQQRQFHQASQSCPMLRRATGGGAIVHDRELTYSLVVPVTMAPTRTADLYDVIHQAFCHWLIQAGLSAFPFDRQHWVDGVTVDSKAFLCFQRRADGDVVSWAGHQPVSDHRYDHPGYKLLGSAQRKQKNALLQHGSILLGRSQAAPELPGLMDLPGYRGPREADALLASIQNHLSDAVGRHWEWQWEADSLTADERERIPYWITRRFDNPEWNLAR